MARAFFPKTPKKVVQRVFWSEFDHIDKEREEDHIDAHRVQDIGAWSRVSY